jgi:hypothetical protein
MCVPLSLSLSYLLLGTHKWDVRKLVTKGDNNYRSLQLYSSEQSAT